MGGAEGQWHPQEGWTEVWAGSRQPAHRPFLGGQSQSGQLWSCFFSASCCLVVWDQTEPAKVDRWLWSLQTALMRCWDSGSPNPMQPQARWPSAPLTVDGHLQGLVEPHTPRGPLWLSPTAAALPQD